MKSLNINIMFPFYFLIGILAVANFILFIGIYKEIKQSLIITEKDSQRLSKNEKNVLRNSLIEHYKSVPYYRKIVYPYNTPPYLPTDTIHLIMENSKSLDNYLSLL